MKKKSRRQKDRERARAEWVAGRRTEIVRSSRQLDEEERERIWRGLRDAWGIEWFGWYTRPDRRAPHKKWRGQFASARKRWRGQWPATSEIFCSTVFDPDEEGNVCELLRMALVTHGVSRVYELRDDEDYSHEIDAGAIEVIYGGGIWTDGTFEWVIELLHEDAVSVAGDWLLRDLKEAWPGWRDSLYRAP